MPLKPSLLATMKSTNYLLNALVAMEAESRGAHLGIQIDEHGFLAEVHARMAHGAWRTAHGACTCAGIGIGIATCTCTCIAT